MRIIISSGHGKHVPGAIGIINEVTEARTVTDQVTDILLNLGIDAEAFHENNARNQRDNVNAIVRHHNNRSRDLDVSVHFNAFEPTRKPRGVEVLYNTEKELAQKVSDAISNSSDLRNRGAKLRTDLGFLNNTTGPAILIEVCFVDSVADVELYHMHFKDICFAIAKSVSGTPLTGAFPISETNIQAMVDLGVINSPDYWKNVTNVEWLNQLLKNAARPGLLDKRIENNILDTNAAIEVLQDAGIINTSDYWVNLLRAGSVPHLDQLLINISKRCRM